jgi:hypothetical protein
LQLIQAKYTVGHELLENQYEIEVVKRDLTRNLTVLFPDIYDEIEKAFDEYIPRTEGIVIVLLLPTQSTDWKQIFRLDSSFGSEHCNDDSVAG